MQRVSSSAVEVGATLRVGPVSLVDGIVRNGGAAVPRLKFTVQPTNAGADVPIAPSPAVAVVDVFDRLEKKVAGIATAAIGTNPAAGALAGDTTQPITAAVATFAGLSINNAGVGYTLAAANGAVTPAVSAAFEIEAS